MNIQTLREFVCLSKCLSFTAAAKQCFISQPVLSKHITALENTVGMPLFVRTRQSVRLTDAGQEFAADMEKVVNLYDASLRKASLKKGDSAGILHVGFLSGATRSFLQDVCADFMVKASDAEIALNVMEGSAMMRALNDNDIDIAVMMILSDLNPNRYAMRTIFEDNYGVAVPIDDPLAENLTLDIAALAGKKLAIPKREKFWEEWNFLRHYLSRGGATSEIEILDIINDATDFNVLPMIKDCYIVMPSHMAFLLDLDRLKFIPFSSEVMPPVAVKAVWKRLSDSNLVRAFLDSMIAVVSEKEIHDLLNSIEA